MKTSRFDGGGNGTRTTRRCASRPTRPHYRPRPPWTTTPSTAPTAPTTTASRPADTVVTFQQYSVAQSVSLFCLYVVHCPGAEEEDVRPAGSEGSEEAATKAQHYVEQSYCNIIQLSDVAKRFDRRRPSDVDQRKRFILPYFEVQECTGKVGDPSGGAGDERTQGNEQRIRRTTGVTKTQQWLEESDN